MNTENVDLMKMARDSLEGNWALAIGTFVVYLLLTGIANSHPPSLSIISILISGPLALGAAGFSLSIARGKQAKTEQLFNGFNNFVTALVAYLLSIIFVCLWSLLLIIPGIIAALSYSMTFFILFDHPSMSAMDALKKSKELMDGHKMKLFDLWVNFFLLSLVCILTLGIGFLWLFPFIHVCMAKFYDDIKVSENIV